MKINFRNLGFSAAFLTALYAFTGCNESTILGKDLIPGSDKVTVKDTTINNLITLNVAEADSSIWTGYTNYGATLGSITDDPTFGKSYGFLYTQVGLPKGEFSFAGTGQTLDSVVLYIGCDTLWYGENQGMNLKVYRMNEPGFKHDSLYSYTRPLSYDPGELLANVTAFPVYPKDSISIYGVKQPPVLRIPLSAAFGNLLLQQRADGAFKDDTTFSAFLKGIAIVPDTNVSKTMLFVDVNKGDTRISVYYKNSTDDSLIADFPFQQYWSAHANFFGRNYNNAEAGRYINTNKPLGDTAMYLQEGPGIYTKLTIPGLENFPKAIINRAELVFTEINTNLAGKEKIFTEPDQMMLWRYITHDSLGYIVDYGNPQSPDLANFGGNRTVISSIGGIEVVQYKFNIARHLQFIMDKKLDNTVFKVEPISNRHLIDMRSVKTGGGNGTPPINAKLRIIYTQL
ncbi:DUF4270 family protein [Chitinophaga sp. SYP-B3965]|uniref:DUF4270 family protein n=1 Tax=Chitinophaga sp. SYP-B3965 TaxID=2663120 RepID=UPI0012995B78